MSIVWVQSITKIVLVRRVIIHRGTSAWFMKGTQCYGYFISLETLDLQRTFGTTMLAVRWLLLLAYLLLLSWTTTAEQLYVISSSSTSCPREPCHTLTDMVQNPSQYFASNTVITLLPGDHQTNISRNLTVLIKDVRNISLIGSGPSNSVLLCMGSQGFHS